MTEKNSVPPSPYPLPQAGGDKNATLTAFRQQIDALDDKLIALLTERIGIIAQVGEFKRKTWPDQCPVRAGREADMVRRVMQKFEGTDFSPAAAAAMWRILIGTSTALESPLSFSVLVSDQEASLYWLAREYFGPTLPVTRQPHVKRVISDVMDGKTSIGILPLLSPEDTSRWWTSLMSPDKNTPKIFAHLPFVYEGTPSTSTAAALAIARIEPEATGNDVSLIVIETEFNVSQHRLQTAFSKLNLEARWIQLLSLTPNTRHHVLEVNGFLSPTEPAMKSFMADLGSTLVNVHYLGAYAAPIILKSTQTAPTAYAKPAIA